MNATSSPDQCRGGYTEVPKYTLGNLRAMAMHSATHGQPVCDSTKRTWGKYRAGRSMLMGTPHSLGMSPPEVPACMTKGTS